jgi:hypothetical protein
VRARSFAADAGHTSAGAAPRAGGAGLLPAPFDAARADAVDRKSIINGNSSAARSVGRRLRSNIPITTTAVLSTTTTIVLSIEEPLPVKKPLPTIRLHTARANCSWKTSQFALVCPITMGPT